MSTPLDLTVVMPCYLGDYEGAANHRPQKLHRAVVSFLMSRGSFTRELALVSDGCDETDAYFSKLAQNYGGSGEANSTVQVIPDVSVRHIRVEKQADFGSSSRNAAIETARGKWIAYLDADDTVLNWHFDHILRHTADYDWVWFDDIWAPRTTNNERRLRAGMIGTGCFAHRSSLPVRWNTDYCADWGVVQQLLALSPNHTYIGNGGYVVQHIPGQSDY